MSKELGNQEEILLLLKDMQEHIEELEEQIYDMADRIDELEDKINTESAVPHIINSNSLSTLVVTNSGTLIATDPTSTGYRLIY